MGTCVICKRCKQKKTGKLIFKKVFLALFTVYVYTKGAKVSEPHLRVSGMHPDNKMEQNEKKGAVAHVMLLKK
jgi:hypothetical protein